MAVAASRPASAFSIRSIRSGRRTANLFLRCAASTPHHSSPNSFSTVQCATLPASIDVSSVADAMSFARCGLAVLVRRGGHQGCTGRQSPSATVAVRQLYGLAPPAGAPGQAAAAAATTAAAAAAAASAAPSAASPATAAAATAAAAAPGDLHTALRQPSGFLVEHVEGRQIDIGDFFVTQHDVGHEIWRRRCGVCSCDRYGSRGSAPCKQGQAGSSQHWYRFLHSFTLRLLLFTWHSELPPCLDCNLSFARLSYALSMRLARSLFRVTNY
jgi:hypothetical protein